MSAQLQNRIAICVKVPKEHFKYKMVFRITMITIVNTDTRTQQAINGEYKIYFKGLTFDWKLGYCYNKQFLSYLEKQDSFLLNGGADSEHCCISEVRAAKQRTLTYFVGYHCTADLLFDWFGFDQTCKSLSNSTQAKQLNHNQSNRRSAIQWYFPLRSMRVFSGPSYTNRFHDLS